MTKDAKGEEKQKRAVRKRWTAARKREAVLRLLKGERIDSLSQELGVSAAQLETWKEQVMHHMELLLREQPNEPMGEEPATIGKMIWRNPYEE